MIEFDINKLRVETYKVKALTTALGGSISVLDEEASTDDREVFHRIRVPMSVVRAFQVRHKTMKYIRPCLVAVAFYGDRAISIERHPAGCMGEMYARRQGVAGNLEEARKVLDETVYANMEATMERWIPVLESNIEKVIRPLIEQGEKWYFDGRYIFSFNKSTAEQAVRAGDFLSKDGRFRCVDVDAIGLHKLDDKTKLDPVDRTCLAYVAANGQFAISPPIWKDAKAVGQAKIKGAEKVRSKGERDFSFDSVDEFCAVNISFALKAAAQLSKEFGFEAIEPLNLPSLMIRLNTVNLPKVASEVKDTFDSGMTFTHALAWLLGFARRCENLDTYATIRALLKYLTSNGLFFKSAFDPVNIFKEGVTLDDIPHLSKKEALEADIYKLSIEDRLEILRSQRAVRLGTSGSGLERGRSNVIGGALYSDEDDG